MAFAFRQAVPLDQVQLDPSLALMGTRDAPAVQAGAPQGQAMPAQAAPQAPPQMAPQAQPANGNVPALADIPVSKSEAIMAWLAHGGTPAEAAHSVRAVKLQNIQDQIGLQQAQQAFQAIQKLPPEQQLAIYLNRGEAGKALADRMQTHALTGGQTLVNGGPNGDPYTATTYGFDSVSGKGYGIGPNVAGGTQSYGPGLGGDYDAKDGVIFSKRNATVGNTYSTPQMLAPGASGVPFTPSIAGGAPGVPALASVQPQGAAPPPQFGSSDALAAIRSLVPGATVTSAQRTPQHNADVGGVPNSMHLSGNAVDFVPPPGMDLNTFRTSLQQRGLPVTELLNEGDHVHWGWAPKGATQAAPSGQGAGFAKPFAQGRTPEIIPPGDPVYSRFPPGTVLQRSAAGEISVAQKPEYDPTVKNSMRDAVLKSPEYTQAKAALSAYQAMVANSSTMTGPSAYAMLDTFARAINPGAVARPTVIETIEKNLGLPAQLVGSLESKFGHGNLPPQVRQQIIDAVVPFAQSHWDQANMMNTANIALARQHGFEGSDVTAPLETRPQRLIAAPGGAITEAQAIAQAQRAIHEGRDRNAVIHRLKTMGVNPRGL